MSHLRRLWCGFGESHAGFSGRHEDQRALYAPGPALSSSSQTELSCSWGRGTARLPSSAFLPSRCLSLPRKVWYCGCSHRSPLARISLPRVLLGRQAGLRGEGRAPLAPAYVCVAGGTRGGMILPALWRTCPGLIGQNVQPARTSHFLGGKHFHQIATVVLKVGLKAQSLRDVLSVSSGGLDHGGLDHGLEAGELVAQGERGSSWLGTLV